MGLHTRPATVIAKLLQGSRATVHFSYRDETINARSIIGILMLAVGRNAHITITTEGEDAEEVMGRLVEAFEQQFWE